MPWVADALAWTAGASTAWRRLIAPILEASVELRP